MRNPVTGAELDAAWLSDALAPRTGGASITSIDAEPLVVRDALFTRPVRLAVQWDRPDLPSHLVAKAATGDAAAAALGAAMGVFEREAGFYDHIVDTSGVRAPSPWYVWCCTDSTLLVLEDLTSLRLGDGVVGLSVDDVEVTLRCLAAMHARWWGGAGLEGFGFLRRGDPVRLRLLDEQCRELLPTFLLRCARGWTDIEIAAVTDCAQEPSASWAPLFEGEVTLVHGDVKPGNLFFDGETPVFVDWQAAGVASPALDVASLLGSALPSDVLASSQQWLLDGYLEVLEGHGITLDRASWREQLHRAARAMLAPVVSASEVADESLAATMAVTGRRRASLVASLQQN